MRLSDAIATGRVLMPEWDSLSYCHCALAAGLRGAGKIPDNVRSTHAWWTAAVTEWPWIRSIKHHEDHGNVVAHDIIGRLFTGVHHGWRTLDQLIDWVRANEPAEQEPMACETLQIEAALEPAKTAPLG